MGALLTTVLAWFGRAFLPFLTFKTFFGGMFLSILVVYLHNFLVETLVSIFGWILSTIGSVGGSGPSVSALQFTGVAGYLATQFRLPECLAFVISMILLKWSLRKIPFFRW